MTKFKEDAFNSLISTGVKTLKAFLLYGSDEGMIDEYRVKLVKAICEDIKDPFRIVNLTSSDVREDPSVLSAEANAITLMGGRRVVTIRNADNYLTKSLKEFLESYKGDTLIIVTAGSLKSNDSLPTLFDKASDLGLLACYADEAESLKKLVVNTLKENNLSASPDVIQYIANNLGADRLLSRSELEKLCVYMGKETTITMEDAEACIGDATSLPIDVFLYALTGGDQTTLHSTLDRLFASGEAPITLLRLANSHLKKFYTVFAQIQNGTDQSSAVRSLFLNFKRVGDFTNQLRRWDLNRITKAMNLLLNAEKLCKVKENPPKLIVGRAFLAICAMSGIRR